MSFASRYWLMPSEDKNSSRRISPGWTGGSLRRRHGGSSMVIDDFHVVCLATLPVEADTILSLIRNLCCPWRSPASFRGDCPAGRGDRTPLLSSCRRRCRRRAHGAGQGHCSLRPFARRTCKASSSGRGTPRGRKPCRVRRAVRCQAVDRNRSRLIFNMDCLFDGAGVKPVLLVTADSLIGDPTFKNNGVVLEFLERGREERRRPSAVLLREFFRVEQDLQLRDVF